MSNQLQMAASIALIEDQHKQLSAEKKDDQVQELFDLGPAAAIKLAANGDRPDKLQKK